MSLFNTAWVHSDSLTVTKCALDGKFYVVGKSAAYPGFLYSKPYATRKAAAAALTRYIKKQEG